MYAISLGDNLDAETGCATLDEALTRLRDLITNEVEDSDEPTGGVDFDRYGIAAYGRNRTIFASEKCSRLICCKVAIDAGANLKAYDLVALTLGGGKGSVFRRMRLNRVRIQFAGLLVAAALSQRDGASAVQESDVKRAESGGLIHPRVTLQMFEHVCGMARLSDAQRQWAATSWTTYESQFSAIEARLADRESRLRIERLSDKGANLTDDERERLLGGLAEQWKQSFIEAETALSAMLDGISVVLDDTQKSDWDRAACWLNRRTRLDPSHRPNGLFYLGEGCDLLQLVDAASKKGGELEWRFADDVADAPADALAEARRALNDCCERYQQSMNAALLASDATFRLEQLKVGMAQARDRVEQARSAWSNATKIAANRSRLNHNYAVEIASVCAAMGMSDHALRWRERSLRGMYPAIVRDETPDRMFEWIEKNIPDERVKQRSVSVYLRYRQDRVELWEECTRMLAKMRESHDPASPPVRSGAGGTPLEGVLHHHAHDLLERRRRLAAEVRGKFAALIPASLSSRFEIMCDELRDAPASDDFPFSF